MKPINTTGLAHNFDEFDMKKRNKYEEGFITGYKNAQADVAQQMWQDTTGKREEEKYYVPKLKRIKVPAQEINGVTYEEHYETVEVFE
ncbi:MAG: hypothetical protein KKH94_02320 [Candidatus Omnitrophica bacterium]|nr:hypothetical protein [Candidatus Omnitrophota bacterium]